MIADLIAVFVVYVAYCVVLVLITHRLEDAA